MAKADHFFVWRRHCGVPYQHHAIDLGDGTVVHFTDGEDGVAGPGGTTENFVIRRTPIEMVTRDGRDRIHVIEHGCKLDDESVVERALSQVGRKGYHLLFDNCEHFACWCAVNRDVSRQVSVAHERLTAAGVKTIASVALRSVSILAAKRATRAASPWMVLSDAAQWATEAGGHHVGLVNPNVRKTTGRAIGGLTALGIGAFGGPIGILAAGSIWAAGELAGEASQVAYDRVRMGRR